MKTSVYPAGEPMRGKWVLQWQSYVMLAPAFWYYNSEQEAVKEKLKLLANSRGEDIV